MYQNQQMQAQDLQQQMTRGPLSSLSLSNFLRLSYFVRKQHHNHRHNQHHRQKHKPRRYSPRCGLVLLIFLSVIKDSLTTYSTSYSSAQDVTTTAPQTNILPYFDFDVPRNVTVTVGQTGFLHCRVERLGDKDVSWIRKRDLHILTAGSTTYTSDQRFQVLRPENSGNWTLQIKYPQPRDSGIYECQINTEPKMSLSYTFNVVELKATIMGPTDLYVKSGSDINLTCKIMQGPHELGNIFWYKGSEIIDMNTNQNEIDSGTRITVENDWSDGLTSRLKIRGASSSDTGNYTCVPTIAKSSSVYVHVIIGEHPAAMQHNTSNTNCANIYLSLCCMFFTFLTCYLQRLMCTNSNNGRRATATLITTTLATKRESTSAAPPSVAIVTASAALQSVALLASALASTSTSKTKTETTSAPAVSKISQWKPHIFSLAAHAKSKPFSSSAVLFKSTTTLVEASTTTLASASASASVSASVSSSSSATTTTFKRIPLMFSNRRISR